nr:hypothetical protein [Tanacetum cinerariifolium]
MERLLFCDYHNMVAILEKGEHNVDFHPIVDFIEASPLRYALIVKPTVYVSHIRQFWSTARIETTEEGTKILATIDDQDRATIAKSSTLPHDSAPRVTSYAAVEGSMKQTILELTALCTSLQRQLSELTDKFQAQEVEIHRLKESIKLLEEREGVAAKSSGDDAPIKGRSMDEGEAATERISDDSEEMATVLTSIDAATVLASRVIDVPTGSGSIPTSSTPVEGSVPTGSEEVPTTSPVFATATVIDAQVARELEEQLEREDQRRVEQIARDAKVARIHVEEELQKAERIKRKGINLEQESAKKQKTSEDVTEEAKPPEEVTEENKVYHEGHRSYWKITRLGGSSASYQFFIDLLKHLDREDLNQLWRLVKETLNNRPPISDKEMELWRSQDDNDKDEGHFAGSDRGASKGMKSQPKSPGKSAQAKEPEFEVGDTNTPQEKLDWENPKGGDYPFDISKPLPLIKHGNHQSVPVEFFINNDLKYLQGGISTMTYTTSTTKTKATQYDLPGIKDMFSDGTLTRFLSSLEDINKNIDMEYLPKRRWSTLEKKRAHYMIKDINKLLMKRRMMRSLEKFVGGRLYESEHRLLQRTIWLCHIVIISQ